MAAAARPLAAVGQFVVEHEVRKHSGEEEGHGVEDAEGKRGLEHGADLLGVLAERVARALAPEAERAQGGQEGAAVEVVAVLVDNAAQQVHGGDKGAEEAQVDEGDEYRRSLGAGEANQRLECPHAGQDGDNEHDEDVRRSQHVGLDKAIDEPGLRRERLALRDKWTRPRAAAFLFFSFRFLSRSCATYQHSYRRNQGDKLANPPAEEKEVGEHGGQRASCPSSSDQ
ncbi:hypothetical protein LOZ65_000793 [Ophidiomyces ophidiicola]|nr:hypothetical protein LOZ65_000793 [Ophidiomyces ophidiicola]